MGLKFVRCKVWRLRLCGWVLGVEAEVVRVCGVEAEVVWV